MTENIACEYKCGSCSYIYIPQDGDPSQGVKPNTAFEDLPHNWVCPVCGAAKNKLNQGEDHVFCTDNEESRKRRYEKSDNCANISTDHNGFLLWEEYGART